MQQKSPEEKTSGTEKPIETKTLLLPSRLYCRLRNLTGSAKRLAGFTADKEFHLSLKKNILSYNQYFITNIPYKGIEFKIATMVSAPHTII